jgi:glutathione peroxidase-family protein
VNTHEFSVRTADGATEELRDYAGRLMLIVSVASKCGFTAQCSAGSRSMVPDVDLDNVLGG